MDAIIIQIKAQKFKNLILFYQILENNLAIIIILYNLNFHFYFRFNCYYLKEQIKAYHYISIQNFFINFSYFYKVVK